MVYYRIGSLKFIMINVPSAVNRLVDGDFKIHLCCYGAEGKKFANSLLKLGIEVCGIYEDDAEARGQAQKIFGNVFPIGNMEGKIDKESLIVICSNSPYNGIYQKISPNRELDFIPLFAIQCLRPDVFEPFMFYKDLQEEYRDHSYILDFVKTFLSDEESIKTFETVLEYTKTFDQALIDSCVKTYSDILNSELFSGTVISNYIDGGVFNGNTIDDVANSRFSDLKQVFAYEPSVKMAGYLRDKYKSLPYEIYDLALSDRNHEMRFSNDNSTTSMECADSDNIVNAVSIDSHLREKDIKVDLIKFNIEGAEINALRGAVNRIRKDKPILAIHSYHKPSHLWEVPILIKSINKDYKLYFRHQDSSVMESVFYAFP